MLFGFTIQGKQEVDDWFLVKNMGQWKEDFLYKAQLHGAWFYLHQDGYTIKLTQTEGMDEVKELLHHKHFKVDSSITLNHHAIKVKWLNTFGSNITQHEAHSFYHNYYIGNNPSFWKSKVPVAKNVTVKSLYPGIDWKVYAPNFIPKHELIVSPGADLSKVAFSILGAEGVSVNREGVLEIATSLGAIKESKPLVWQIIEGSKVYVDCEFAINQTSQIVSYKLGEYNKSLELIIDPILIFSTYSGSLGDNFGFTATYDSQGHLYAGGIVDGEDGEYPWTFGAFQTVYGGSTGGQAPINLACDISISKYAPNGQTLLYATYLGGARNEHPHSLVVDLQDNLIVFGTTNSIDFPVDSFGFDTTHNGGYDLILSKFSVDGSTLLGGTFVGGSSNDGINNGLLRFNYADDFRGDVYVDSANMIYLATCTSSGDFPTTSGVTQSSFGGAIDAVVLKMDSLLTKLEWATFFGASGHDAAYSIKVIDSIVYIAGGTSSPGMNQYANGAQTSYNGGIADGFLASFKKDTCVLLNFTFFGTPSYDQIFFIDFDTEKNLYFSGQTKGTLTRSPNTYGQDNTGQFIGKINPSLSTIELVTTFGNRQGASKPDLSPSAFLVDKCDNIYFSGWGADIDNNPGSTFNLPLSSDALQSTTDGNDFYLIVLSRELQNLIHATYFGGAITADHVDGGTSRFDKDGVIYQSVCASCPNNQSQSFLSDFPVTSDAVFTQNFSSRCSNAAFKIDFRVTFNVEANFTHDPIFGCSPLEVDFTNTSFGGDGYLWVFGDGNSDTIENPKHIFNEPGIYQIKLFVFDQNSCNRVDSAIGSVEVIESPVPEFKYEITPCKLELQLINTTDGDYEYNWDLGDGTRTQEKNPYHLYPWGGQFRVVLFLENPENGCKDSTEELVTFPEYPFTELEIPNVFTPNNDGLNDCYTILGISEECEQGEIIIYNRWGDRVYKGSITDNCWNGRIENVGNELPSGVYYYLLQTEREGKPSIRTNGVIHLIRE